MVDPMFHGELGFLSNFDTTPFHSYWLGRAVKSAEHAFNAVKTQEGKEQLWVLEADSPAEAKKRGRKVTLREGWDTGVRVASMQAILREKFSLPMLKTKLLETGTTPLVETNYWHDNFWGDCLCLECVDWDGKNMLGELLMAIRATSV